MTVQWWPVIRIDDSGWKGNYKAFSCCWYQPGQLQMFVEQWFMLRSLLITKGEDWTLLVIDDSLLVTYAPVGSLSLPWAPTTSLAAPSHALLTLAQIHLITAPQRRYCH